MVLPLKSPRYFLPANGPWPDMDGDDGKRRRTVGIEGWPHAEGLTGASAEDLRAETPPGPEVENPTDAILRLFISCPAVAEEERGQVHRVVAVLNSAFEGAVRIALPDAAKAFEKSAGRDAVVAILGPRADADLAGSPGQARSGGMAAAMSAAIDGRAPGAPLPDFFIFRHGEPARDPAGDDPDWDRRKAMFGAWYRARGGEFVSFDDYLSQLELTTKVYRRLRRWLARNGHANPTHLPPPSTLTAVAPAIESPVAPPPEARIVEAVIVGAGTGAVEQPEFPPPSVENPEPAAIAPSLIEQALIAPAAAEFPAPARVEPAAHPAEQTEIAAPEPAAEAPVISVATDGRPAVDDTRAWGGPSRPPSVAEAGTEARPTEQFLPGPVSGAPDIAVDGPDERQAYGAAILPVAGAAVVKDRGSRKVLAGLLAASMIASAGSAWMWRSAAMERDRADAKLAAAADAAGALVFDLTQKPESQPAAESQPAEGPAAGNQPDATRITEGPQIAGGQPTGARTATAPAVAIDTARVDAARDEILAAAQKLQDTLILASVKPGPEQRREAETLTGKSTSLLKQGDTVGALKAAMRARGIYLALSTAEPAEPEWSLGLSEADRRIGNALLAQGHVKDALAAFRTGFAIARGLTEASPDNGDWQRNLEETHIAMGNALMAQGRGDDALAAYRQGVTVAKALAQAAPTDLPRQQSLALAQEKIAGALVSQDHFDDALTAYRDGLVVRKALVLKDPGNTEWQGDLAWTEQRIGDLLVVQGHLDGGLASYRDAIAIRKALTQKDPDNAEWQRGLYESCDSEGDALAGRRNLDEALGAYRDAFVVARAMATKEPADSRWQRAVAVTDDKIGDLLATRGRTDDALAAYREALGMVKSLAVAEPAKDEWRSLTATIDQRMGDALASENHLESALAAYREDLGALTELARKDPGNSVWLRGISDTQTRVGAILFQQGQVDDAIAAHRESLLVTKSLAKKDPDNVRWQRDLLMDNSKIGQMLLSEGKRDDALVAYRDGLKVAKALAQKDQDNAEWLSSQAMIDSNIGAILIQAGHRDDALAVYHDGLLAAKALVKKDAQNVEWQTGVVVGLYNLAEIGESTVANFGEALQILRHLDEAGLLPPEKKDLILRIEDKLNKIHRPQPPAKAMAGASTAPPNPAAPNPAGVNPAGPSVDSGHKSLYGLAGN
jgi:tetratricopeptide (TPR) repeat protein